MQAGWRQQGDDGRDADERDAAARLSVGDRQRRLRRFWRSIPGPPRCKLCHRPFGGIGGPIMRLAGLGRWPGNPKYCRGCFRPLYRRRSGAEIECSEARSGEILVPPDVLRLAPWPVAHLEHRRVELKGKAEPMEVAVLDASSVPP